MEENYLCAQDPEAAFGTESATRGGSYWTRFRWGKAVAAPGVRGQDAREKWKKTIFVLRIQKRRLAAKVRPGEARFGPELDGVKPWRRQVFGAKMREKNGRKRSLFLRIQKRRLVPKVRPGEARFGPELDGEKPWRCQVFGARMREKKRRKLSLFYKDPEAAFGTESATRGGSFWTRIRWGKVVAAPGVRGQDAREKWKKTVFGLFGSRSGVWYRKWDQGRLVLNQN